VEEIHKRRGKKFRRLFVGNTNKTLRPKTKCGEGTSHDTRSTSQVERRRPPGQKHHLTPSEPRREGGEKSSPSGLHAMGRRRKKGCHHAVPIPRVPGATSGSQTQDQTSAERTFHKKQKKKTEGKAWVPSLLKEEPRPGPQEIGCKGTGKKKK